MRGGRESSCGKVGWGGVEWSGGVRMGRKIGRIIEIEEVDTGKRVHGTARKLERLVLALRRSNADADGVPA